MFLWNGFPRRCAFIGVLCVLEMLLLSETKYFDVIQATCDNVDLPNNVTIVTGVPSVIACSALCYHDVLCLSVLYGSNTGTCFTNHDVTHTPVLPTDCGWWYVGMKLYGMPCPNEFSSPKYRCVNGLYDCALGYAFNPSTQECGLGCLEYGTTFQRAIDYAVGGTDDYISTASSEEECETNCINFANFTCVAAEFFFYYYCALLPVSAVSKGFFYDKNTTMSHRNCA